MSKVRLYIAIGATVQTALFFLMVYLMTTVNPVVKQPEVNKPKLRSLLDDVFIHSTAENKTFSLFNNTTVKPEDGLFSLFNNSNEMVLYPQNFTQSLRKTQIYPKAKYYPKTGPCLDDDHTNDTEDLQTNQHHGLNKVAVISLKNVSNNKELLQRGKTTEVCKKSECIYRLVIDDNRDDRNNTKKSRRDTAPMSPVEDFKRSLNDSNLMQMRFMGHDKDGTPLVEIKLGTNLIIAEALVSGNVSRFKWLPNNKTIVANESNASFFYDNMTFGNLTKNFKLHCNLSNETDEKTRNVTENYKTNGIVSNHKHFLVEIKQEITENMTDLISNVTDNVSIRNINLTTDNRQPQPIQSEYEKNFGEISEVTLGDNLDLFFGNNTQLETDNSLEEKEPQENHTDHSNNFTESAENNTNNSEHINDTDLDKNDFKTINSEIIDITEKEKNVSISVEAVTDLENDDDY